MRVADKRLPSFMGLTAASQASSYAKKMNRSSDTAQECTLRKLLWRSGLRYRKNVRTLMGKPDIVLSVRGLSFFVTAISGTEETGGSCQPSSVPVQIRLIGFRRSRPTASVIAGRTGR